METLTLRRRGKRAARGRMVAGMLVVALVLGAGLGAASVQAAPSTRTIQGTVGSGPVVGPGTSTLIRENARVVLYGAGARGARRLGSTVTDATGAFSIDYRAGRAGVLYVVSTGGRLVAAASRSREPVGGSRSAAGSSPPARDVSSAPARAVRLMSVLERPVRDGAKVHVSELTTVASVYALQQFMAGQRISGPAPGLPIAADTAQSLAETATGKPSLVIGNPPNGNATEALPTLNTLANVLVACTRGTAASCARLFAVSRAPGQRRARDTLQATLNIANRPTHAVGRLVRGQRRAFRPALGTPPRALVIALVHTDGGFNAPGRMAFDSRGRIWSNNNFARSGTEPGHQLTVLSPTGTPVLSSPLRGGGLDGSGFGVTVDLRDRVWVSNWAGNSLSLFNAKGRALSPPSGFTQGDPVKPQGMAVSRDGSLWIANSRADYVTLYRGGDPRRWTKIAGEGIANSFSIALDARGDAWVTNESLTAAPGSVTRITREGTADLEVTGGGLSSPMGIAVDRGGNKWVANFASDSVTRIDAAGVVSRHSPIRSGRSLRGPWGIAVDGDDNVWVSGFRGRTLTELCGRLTSACPPGSATGEAISPRGGYTSRGMQHTTAVQIDSAGNVWLANNWSTATPITNFLGGNGLIEFVGMAAPVTTPILGAPRPGS